MTKNDLQIETYAQWILCNSNYDDTGMEQPGKSVILMEFKALTQRRAQAAARYKYILEIQHKQILAC